MSVNTDVAAFDDDIQLTNCKAVTPFRCLAAMPPEGSTRSGIMPSCPSLDMGSREAKVGFEPRTFAISSRDQVCQVCDSYNAKTIGSHSGIHFELLHALVYYTNTLWISFWVPRAQWASYRIWDDIWVSVLRFSLRQCNPLGEDPKGELAQWLERELTNQKLRRSNPTSAPRLSCLGVGSLAVSKPSCFFRVKSQLGTGRVLQLDDFDVLLRKTFRCNTFLGAWENPM
ncbi:hypothetical protein CSKR_105185 [Clonorchis sinensis]|uniref:Uncharacterized protein n=1 Tax=Clonorchis sinensis TaxID=79923 RepID=A0A3R7GDF7_CLOSI|nr:hypothetical protein CSKR_105185 [Clonorchis sinensis]